MGRQWLVMSEKDCFCGFLFLNQFQEHGEIQNRLQDE